MMLNDVTKWQSVYCQFIGNRYCQFIGSQFIGNIRSEEFINSSAKRPLLLLISSKICSWLLSSCCT